MSDRRTMPDDQPDGVQTTSPAGDGDESIAMNFSSTDASYATGGVDGTDAAVAVDDGKGDFIVDSFEMGAENAPEDPPDSIADIDQQPEDQAYYEFTFDNAKISSVSVGAGPEVAADDSGAWVDLVSFSQPVHQPGSSASEEPPLDGVPVFVDTNELEGDAGATKLHEDGVVGPKTEDPVPTGEPESAEYILEPVFVTSYDTGSSGEAEVPVPGFGMEDSDPQPTLADLAPSDDVVRSGVGGETDVVMDDLAVGVELDDIVDG